MQQYESGFSTDQTANDQLSAAEMPPDVRLESCFFSCFVCEFYRPTIVSFVCGSQCYEKRGHDDKNKVILWHIRKIHMKLLVYSVFHETAGAHLVFSFFKLAVRLQRS